MRYTIHRVAMAPALDCNWNAPVWAAAETTELTHLREESSDHKPKVQVRLLHDSRTLYGIFQIEDRYVVATRDHYQADVCQDSCAEFFFKPAVGPGYFNLEMSASGAYLFYYVRDCTRTEDGFVDYSPVAEEFGRLVSVRSSLAPRVYPEIATPLTWQVQFAVPMAALEPYCGKIDDLSGALWHCNFYKCAGDSSHPHWLTWSPVPRLNFHLPEAFAELAFA